MIFWCYYLVFCYFKLLADFNNKPRVALIPAGSSNLLPSYSTPINPVYPASFTICNIFTKSIVDFGAFINILPGKDGLVHISQIANERVENVSDHLKEGEVVRVKVLDVDQRGRIKLSIKELLEDEAPAATLEAAE